ncbi:MAG: hypothetical protein F6K42_15160 [Leptolyngbya sp. SIO1D8]|nr:hypothetical protein [Leptolyngbya sp. SIO1D8]
MEYATKAKTNTPSTQNTAPTYKKKAETHLPINESSFSNVNLSSNDLDASHIQMWLRNATQLGQSLAYFQTSQSPISSVQLKADYPIPIQCQGYGYEDEERVMSVPVSYGYEDEENLMSIWNERLNTPDSRPLIGTAHKPPKEMLGCDLTENEVKSSPDWCLDRYQKHSGETCYREIPKNGLGGDQYCYTPEGYCHSSPDLISPASPSSQGRGQECGFDLPRAVGHGLVDWLPQKLTDWFY